MVFCDGNNRMGTRRISLARQSNHSTEWNSDYCSDYGFDEILLRINYGNCILHIDDGCGSVDVTCMEQ